jgi:competence protein ComGC
MLLVEQDVAKYTRESRIDLPNGVLCRVTYPICNIGERNKNNRIYDKSVWEKVLSNTNLQEKLANRNLYGHAEHPEKTQSNLEKTSHIVTNFNINETDGKVYQTIEVLNTPYGRIVNTLLEAGCGVGVSTRAEGELEEAKDDKGNKYYRVIPETYSYVTTDFTADPSTYGALPTKIEKTLVTDVKNGLEEKQLDKDFCISILENCKTSEAKTLLESVKVNERFFTEEDEEEDEGEPEDGDFLLTPSGKLGSQTSVSVQGGKFLGVFGGDEAAYSFIKSQMKKDNFYPNVWYVSDHGNIVNVTSDVMEKVIVKEEQKDKPDDVPDKNIDDGDSEVEADPDPDDKVSVLDEPDSEIKEPKEPSKEKAKGPKLNYEKDTGVAIGNLGKADVLGVDYHVGGWKTKDKLVVTFKKETQDYKEVVVAIDKNGVDIYSAGIGNFNGAKVFQIKLTRAEKEEVFNKTKELISGTEWAEGLELDKLTITESTVSDLIKQINELKVSNAFHNADVELVTEQIDTLRLEKSILETSITKLSKDTKQVDSIKKQLAVCQEKLVNTSSNNNKLRKSIQEAKDNIKAVSEQLVTKLTDDITKDIKSKFIAEYVNKQISDRRLTEKVSSDSLALLKNLDTFTSVDDKLDEITSLLKSNALHNDVITEVVVKSSKTDNRQLPESSKKMLTDLCKQMFG